MTILRMQEAYLCPRVGNKRRAIVGNEERQENRKKLWRISKVSSLCCSCAEQENSVMASEGTPHKMMYKPLMI